MGSAAGRNIRESDLEGAYRSKNNSQGQQLFFIFLSPIILLKSWGRESYSKERKNFFLGNYINLKL